MESVPFFLSRLTIYEEISLIMHKQKMALAEFTSFCLPKWALLWLYVSSTDPGLIRNSNDVIEYMCCPGFTVTPRV